MESVISWRLDHPGVVNDPTFADSCNDFVNAYIFHQGQKCFNTAFPKNEMEIYVLNSS